MNYVAKYDVAAYMKGTVEIAPAVECVGYFNIGNNCRSMPDLKGKAFVITLQAIITFMVL